MAEHSLEQLLQLAANARSEADAAVLDNVRDRCLRAEAAWLEMAARARRSSDLKGLQVAEKRARPPYLYARRTKREPASVDGAAVSIKA